MEEDEPESPQIRKTDDGLPILKKPTSVTEDGLPILKKKLGTSPFSSPDATQKWLDAQDASNPTPKPSLVGSNPFLNSQHPSELTPVLPQYREQVKAGQQQRSQELTNQLADVRKSMDEEHRKSFDKAINMSTDNGEIKPVTKEEQDHYNFMQTPLGKTLGAAQYIGRQATKGTVQIAKGLAHVADLAQNPTHALSGYDPSDAAFKAVDDNTNFGLTKGDIARIETGNGLGNHLLSAAGQAAEFAPAVAGGEAAETGGVLPKALLYLQGVGQGKEAADKIPNLNPLAKEALIQGSGAVNLALSDIGDKLFGKGVSSALKDKVVTGIAADAIKDAAGKSVSEDGFKSLIDGQVQSFAEKFQRAPQEALKHYVDAAKTFTKLDVGNFSVNKAVDKLQEANGDKPVFNENLGTLAENLNKSYTQSVPMFGTLGAIGAMSKLLPNSVYENDVTKSVIDNPTPENIDAVKSKIQEHGMQSGWTPEELSATNEHIDKIAKAVQSLPVQTKDKSKAVGLVLDRNELQGELDKSVSERQKLDPSVADIPSAKEQYLTDKIEQANDKLRGLVTGKKPTYSKGVGDEEGTFFKTTGDEKEEITPSRYDLENTEREAKKQINEQAEPTTEIPVEEQGNEPNKSEKTVIETDAPIKHNSGEGFGKIVSETKNGITYDGREISVDPITKEKLPFGKGFAFGDVSKDTFRSTGFRGILKDKLKEHGIIYTLTGASDDVIRVARKILGEGVVSKKFKIGENEYTALIDENTQNPSIKTIANETSNESNGEKSSQEGREKSGTESKIGNEKNGAEKSNVDPTGGAETSPVTKPTEEPNNAINQEQQQKSGEQEHQERNQSRKAEETGNRNRPIGEKESRFKKERLTTPEHNEANDLLKEHGINIHDYEQSQRDKSGENVPPVTTNEKGAQQPENDRPANDGEHRQGETPKSSKSTFKKPETPKISDKAKDLAERIRSLKSDKNSLHGGLQGVGVAIYDGALETAATVVENGGKLIDAIDAAVKHILANSDEKNENKIRGAITKDLSDAGLMDEEQPEKTGIRHEDTTKERSADGKASDVPKKDRRREVIEAKGKALVDENPDYANQTAKDIIEKERPATDVEQAALEYRKTQLKNERRKILKDTDPENAADNEIRLAKISDEIALNQKATDIGGSELGSGLGYRTQLMNEDYSTETVLGRAKVANGGEPLETKDKEALEKHTKRIDELEGQLSDLEEKLKKQAENGLIDKVKRTADLEERQAKREVTKASLRKEREGLLADLHLIAKKARSSAGANKIPVEMIVPLTKLARNYVLDGATSLASVVDKLYNDLKDHIEDLNKNDISEVVKENFDKYLTEQNELRLNRAKKLQQTKLNKLKEGTFEQKTYAKIKVDNDYLNIRAEINREQQKINKRIADIENSKKSLNRKIVDIAVKYGRQAKLASVSVLGKLAATGLATIGLKPVTEGIGKGLSAILPKVAEKSTVEGAVSRSSMREANRVTEGAAVKSISQAYGRAFTIGMKDAYQELTGAGSNLTNLYKERGATLPAEAKEFFGHLHSAIKAPVKRFAWELSYAKRAAKLIDAGLDPLDPVNDAQNRLNAYKDAEKSIFMGDNTLSKLYENNVSSLEKSNSSVARTAGAAFRIMLPFVKVPSNIVLEGAKYSFGSVSGLARLGRAMSKGFDNLSPEEADIILEHLKKGSIGGAALALGFFNPKMFGGFYQPDKKEKVAPGHIKIGDVNMPAFAVEHPIFIAAQVGANFRQLLDKYKHNDDRIPAAAWGTITGLGYAVPQANEIKRLVDLAGGDQSKMAKLKKFSAETLKGEIEPAALQQLAQITDVKEGAKTTIPGLAFTEQTQQKREPKLKKRGFMKYVGQVLETGIPGLRKNVHKKR